MKPVIKPTKVGDLEVVKQRIARYEAGEIAHIENVMATESRSREHRRLTQREEIFSSESERQTEITKDLQSTERFELQQESQKTIKSESKFEAGANVSGGFGPVTFSAYGKAESSNSTEESEKNASNYAKEITEKTVNKIIERVREKRKTRVLEEIEEINKHGFDNAGGNQHFAGVYRWVDKYYRAKKVNYGKRLFYEFIVPEPAAFYIFAQTKGIEKDFLPEEPQKPMVPGTQTELSPELINRTNYLTLVKNYKVEGVNPPPADKIILGKTFAKDFQRVPFSQSEEIDIPDGYKASKIFLTGIILGDKEDQQGKPHAYLKLLLTNHNDYIIGNWGETARWNGLEIFNYENVIPLVMLGQLLDSVGVSIWLECQIKLETFQKWQLATYSAIMNAYNKQVMEYEERLAAGRVQGGVQISGRNPLINREIEREALKKGCITMWANEQFDNLEGITHHQDATPPDNYPEVNLDQALVYLDKMQFFEQAFDWANLTYEFYPYYWGRKEFWLDKYVMKDSDPMFEAFLRAGSARVIVPVQLDHTKAVLWYQLTGEIYQGGEIPALEGEDPNEVSFYNSCLEDLAEAEGIDDIFQDVEILPDDPDTWLIKVPTSLVWLQGDSTLPDFEAGMTPNDNDETPENGEQNGQGKNWWEALKNFFRRIWERVTKFFGFRKIVKNHANV